MPTRQVITQNHQGSIVRLYLHGELYPLIYPVYQFQDVLVTVDNSEHIVHFLYSLPGWMFLLLQSFLQGSLLKLANEGREMHNCFQKSSPKREGISIANFIYCLTSFLHCYQEPLTLVRISSRWDKTSSTRILGKRVFTSKEKITSYVVTLLFQFLLNIYSKTELIFVWGNQWLLICLCPFPGF